MGAQSNGTRSADAEPKACYQTERKRLGDYSLTRWNSSKWQLRREDYMVCTGARCPYRFCELPDEGLPSAGTLCPWERKYAELFQHELVRLLGADDLRPHLERNPALLWEWTIAYLLTNRASVRLSRAVEEILAAGNDRKNGVIDHAGFKHAALALRYMTAAHNRINVIWAELNDLFDVALQRRREQMIRTEMLAAGYWNPALGHAAPDIEDAPEWILEKVDDRLGIR